MQATRGVRLTPVPLAAAARGAVALAVPLLIGVLTGAVVPAVLAGIGALWGVGQDGSDPYRLRLRRLVRMGLAAACGLLAGGLALRSGHPVAVPGCLVAAALLGGAVSLRGPLASVAGMHLLLGATVGAGVPVPGPWWQPPLALLAGVALVTALSATPWLWRRHAIERDAVLAVYRAAAEALSAAGSAGAEAARRRLTAALDHAHRAMGRHLSRRVRSGTELSALRDAFDTALRLGEVTSALVWEGRVLPAHVRDVPLTLAARLLPAAGAAAAAGPNAPTAGTSSKATARPVPGRTAPPAAGTAGAPDPAAAAGTAPPPAGTPAAPGTAASDGDPAEAPATPHSVSTPQTVTPPAGTPTAPGVAPAETPATPDPAPAAGAAPRPAGAPAASGAPAPGAVPAEWPAAPDSPALRALAELAGRSGRVRPDEAAVRLPALPWHGRAAQVRYAVLLAACVLVAQLCAGLLHGPRGYWLPMTVAFVYKPDFGPVLRRALHRCAGTLVGVAAIGAVTLLTTDAYVLIGAVAAFGAVMAVGVRHHYALATTGLTAVVFVLVDMLGDHRALYSARILDTALAAAIVLVAHFALWPASAAERAAAQTGAALAAARRYRDLPADAAPGRRHALRRTAYHRLAEARRAVAHADAEPGRPGRDLAALEAAVTATERLCDAVSARNLGGGAAPASPGPQPADGPDSPASPGSSNSPAFPASPASPGTPTSPGAPGPAHPGPGSPAARCDGFCPVGG
ncbi:FUSC family protein [Streptomyces sennicomposti]|uniref:FUSC family protein n=1 Tax=Streptomyces sennicomposti TaxID=2873384 RepID=UPI001CA62CAB|nr:FUSC family protein [Streptomyces sennicomposti]MBY8868871.1 FUSC family protein [Streptomyces sennicomposti]